MNSNTDDRDVQDVEQSSDDECHDVQEIKMNSQSNNISLKRKHKTLSIKEKVHILELLEAGTPVKRLCSIYNIGSSTVYDIRRKKDALLQFYLERQSKRGVAPRKTMREGKCNVVEKALVEWFEQRKHEGVTVTGGMLIEQAKILQKELNPDFRLKFSQGWFEKFKSRHGIKLYDENKTSESEEPISYFNDFTEDNLLTSFNSEVVNSFVKKFSDTVTNETLQLDQIYSASQTTLYWRQMPKDIFSSEQESECENSDDKIAVFSCFNAAGTHRCKLLVVNNNSAPNVLNGVKVLPVIYRSNEKTSITRDIMIDWLENHFTLEARAHCTSLGFPEDCKLLLILDSHLAFSSDDVLAIDNVLIIFVPSDCSFSVQPQEQGLTRWLKCCYRLECMADYLEGTIQGKSAENFRNEFDLKASMWALARAWQSLSENVFKHSWYKLRTDLSDEKFSEMDNTEIYVSYKQQILKPIVDHIKSINPNLTKYICYENLDEWIESGDADPFKELQVDQKSSQVKSKENISKTFEREVQRPSIEHCVCLTSELISSLEKQDCITEQEIMYLYMIKAKLVTEKLKNRKGLAKDDSKCNPAKEKKKKSALKEI